MHQVQATPWKCGYIRHKWTKTSYWYRQCCNNNMEQKEYWHKYVHVVVKWALLNLDANTQLVFHLHIQHLTHGWAIYSFALKCHQSHASKGAVLLYIVLYNTSSYVPLYPVDTDDTYVPKKPNNLQITAQREQLTAEECPVAVSRPGKGADKKSKAEPRQPNEPYTANVGSATAPPPGQREAPVGRESVKVSAVQAAPHQLTQVTDTGYGTGTGTSSRNKLGTGMH